MLARLALAAFSLALVLAVGEIIARASWDPLPNSPPFHDPDLPVIRGIFEIGRPNVRGIFHGAYFRTNSAGFRSPEIPTEAPDDVFRIVITGDSVTQGWGVEEQETFIACGQKTQPNCISSPVHELWLVRFSHLSRLISRGLSEML